MATRKAKKSKSAKSAAKATIGIIGGSGLYAMGGLTNAREIRVKTPFGETSDGIVLGTLEGKQVAFLARHGRGHRILPGEINYRANVYALKLLGVERVISVSAVGSLKEDLRPGEFLVADQFVDRTKSRSSTFFGNGLVAHVTFDKPTCAQVSRVLADASVHCAVPVHRKGTYICMEGPQFSTLAMITDYDCWHPDHESVTGAQIMATLQQNADNAQKVLREAIKSMPDARGCKCGSALAHALITDPKLVPKATKKNLSAIIGKY